MLPVIIKKFLSQNSNNMNNITNTPVAYLANFQPMVLKPHIPQNLSVEYIARMISISLCAQNKVSNQEKATQIYKDIVKKMEKYSVSSKHVSQRQINIFPSNIEEIIKNSEVPIADLFKDIVALPRGDILEDRMKYYAKIVTPAIQSFYPEEATKPDDLIHVTCSGYIAPNPAQIMLNKKRWVDVTVTNSYHMGCYGAFPPVRMAAGFLSHSFLLGNQKKQVDIVHTELLFTHLDISRDDPNNLVNMTLFADGFIKYSMHAAPPNNIPPNSLKLLAMHDSIIKDTLNEMTWHLASHQFDMYLSKSVPVLIRDSSINFLNKLCANAGIDLNSEKDSMLFAIHPGGPKILDHLQDIFSLKDWQINISRQVLYENGNMSSSTIPHIWSNIVNNPDIRSGTKIVTLAFGPGLTSSGFILEKT